MTYSVIGILNIESDELNRRGESMSVKTAETEAIDKSFNELLIKARIEAKKDADKIEELPLYASMTDKTFYDRLLALYGRYYAGKITGERRDDEGRQIRGDYTKQFRKDALNWKANLIDQKRYLTGSQTLIRLQNTCDTISQEEYNRMSVILFKNYFNDKSGSIIEYKLKERGWI